MYRYRKLANEVRGKAKEPAFEAFEALEAGTNAIELTRYISDSFEEGFTRANVLSTRPCHFQVRHRTDDAQSGPKSLTGVSESSCARRGCVARQVFTRFLAPFFNGARGAPRGAGSLGRGSRVPVHSLHIT